MGFQCGGVLRGHDQGVTIRRDEEVPWCRPNSRYYLFLCDESLADNVKDHDAPETPVTNVQDRVDRVNSNLGSLLLLQSKVRVP